MKARMPGILLAILVQATIGGAQDLVPLDGRWEYPHYLTWRPGNGQVCDVNPPRFSWPYLPEVIPADSKVPVREFCLQLSRDGDFAKPDVEIRTPYNFYNALPVLADGRWHWRVGYDVDSKQHRKASLPGEQWSVVRSFTFGQQAVQWDRRLINDAAQILSARRHPRLSPSRGDWQEWLKSLEENEQTAQWLKDTLQRAQRVTTRPWWREFPTNDRKEANSYDDQQFAQIGSELALASFAYRLTGQRQFERAKDHALALARFPKGGLASPEYHGPPRKWPTQITEHLALCYDWWYEELTQAQRQTLLDSIDWRLRATYLEKASWRMGPEIAPQGAAMFCQSHPYENFVWSLPGVLLTAGDLAVADELVPMCLNYLTGVTSAHGPDEGWNEGVGYGGWKGQSMLGASCYVGILLPELKIGSNPFYRRLGEWYSHLMPLGIQRLSFGDYSATPERHWSIQRNNARMVAWLTGDGRLERRRRAIDQKVADQTGDRPWLDLLSVTQMGAPDPAPDAQTSAVFPEAGWVMVSTRDPSDWNAFDEAVGMIFQCRPRGGFSHSYRAEGDFVWHAYGQTLSAGGGGTAYPDPHSRSSLSHNVMLIDGQGQQWDPKQSTCPFVGRLLAYEQKDNYIYWCADATHAYQATPGLLRWHRHVVFVEGKWFALFDDLAMRPGAPEARFSWLFHVAPKVPLEMLEDGTGFKYQMENVRAQVAFGRSAAEIEVVNMQRRDGFRNIVTGQDMYKETASKVADKGRELTDEQIMEHNLWVTNRKPTRDWQLATALVAWRQGEKQPKVTYENPRVVSVAWADGSKQSVSFDPKARSDVVIDVGRVAAHACDTDPATLPPSGRPEEVRLGGDTYQVQWLRTETFGRPDWASRWFAEGNSEIQVREGKLHVRNLYSDKANVATIWYRPELPKDVIVRFKTQVIEPAEKNAANLNLILHARENDGTPVRFGRTGQYKEYHTFPNYIVTFVGGYRPGWSRARRDPGFNMLHEAEVRSEIGRQYDIAVTVHKGRLRYYIDGRLVHDVVDPQPLPGGRFAIRTWSTNAWWDDVEFGQVTDSHEGTKQRKPNIE